MTMRKYSHGVPALCLSPLRCFTVLVASSPGSHKEFRVGIGQEQPRQSPRPGRAGLHGGTARARGLHDRLPPRPNRGMARSERQRPVRRGRLEPCAATIILLTTKTLLSRKRPAQLATQLASDESSLLPGFVPEPKRSHLVYSFLLTTPCHQHRSHHTMPLWNE